MGATSGWETHRGGRNIEMGDTFRWETHRGGRHIGMGDKKRTVRESGSFRLPAERLTTRPHKRTDKTLDVLRPVNLEGSYQRDTKGTPTTSTESDSQLNTHSTVEDWTNVGENEVE